MVDRNIAIIPARGGSKRIPDKNVIDFCGKPMIAWTIRAALESKLFDKVLVSTDSSHIAKVAIALGAEVPFLRETASDDFSPISTATLAALLQAEDHWGTKYKNVVQLMANCPLRTSKDIIDAFQKFIVSAHDFQISAFEFGWMNPWWAAKLLPDGRPEPMFREALSKRSQDLESLYCPTGAIWIADADSLRNQKTFYGVGHAYHPMSVRSAIDIDDFTDLEMARAYFTMGQAT